MYKEDGDYHIATGYLLTSNFQTNITQKQQPTLKIKLHFFFSPCHLSLNLPARPLVLEPISTAGMAV